MRLAPEDAREVDPREGAWRPIGASLPSSPDERFLFTATGSFMRNVERDPERGLGLVEVDAAGRGVPDRLGVRRRGPPDERADAAPAAPTPRGWPRRGARTARSSTPIRTNLIALTYALDLDTRALTRLLWEMHTECIVVFPMGCGFVRWRMPGGTELAEATAQVLARRTMAVWQHHGIVAAGPDLEHAFGLIETAEKAAEIYLKAAALGSVTRRLTTEQLTALAANFGVEPDREILGR